jgi:hypothetical protein
VGTDLLGCAGLRTPRGRLRPSNGSADIERHFDHNAGRRHIDHDSTSAVSYFCSHDNVAVAAGREYDRLEQTADGRHETGCAHREELSAMR